MDYLYEAHPEIKSRVGAQLWLADSNLGLKCNFKKLGIYFTIMMNYAHFYRIKLFIYKNKYIVFQLGWFIFFYNQNKTIFG